MKKHYLLFLLLFSTSLSFSQPWLKNLPQNKARESLTFYDYQHAFDEYWAPYHVDRGCYFENGIKIKARGWKQFKRWEYETETRIDPRSGEFPKQTALEVYSEFLGSGQASKSPSTANWISLGTNNSTGGYAGIGRINCITFHPSDNNTYWIGAAAGGIWVTASNGSTWTCLTSNLDALAVSDIVIPSDYTTSSTIYIATGDKDHWDNRSIGVLKSTNGGASWSSTGLSYTLADNKMVNRLLLDPNNNQILVAATSGGVYKTINGGANWSTQLSTLNFIDMEYKPGDFNTLYGCTTDGKIYVTSNGGGNWTQAFTNSSAYRMELAVSANQPTWVYAIAVNSGSGLYGIYKSTSSGTSYSLVFSGTDLNLLGWNSDGLDSGGQGWYDLCLAVSPSNANTLLSGGVNSWRSTNGGTSWAIVNHWWGDGVPAVHADKHKLAFRNNGDLFECNDGGIYISNNNGTAWTDKTNGIVISQMYKLGVAQTVPNETITGLQDNGTKLLSAGSWSDVKGGDGMECLIDYSDVDIQYGTYVNGQIDRTTDHWNNATAIEPAGAGSGAWVTPYIIDPGNPAILYAGYADIWKTTDRGDNWTKISTMNNSDKIRSMAIAPSNTQVLYVASPYIIWKTTNGGTSWTDITGSLPVGSGTITSIAVKNSDAGTLWVTLGGYNASKVYQSVNGGTSWTNISTGLPSIPAYSIVQNKQSAGEEQLYVGTELGVYFKKGSDSWISYNTGLPNVKIGELEIYYNSNPQNSILRTATFGRGLWETPVYYNCTPPTAPVVGTITQPTCTQATGSVILSGLPASGTWTIDPGGYSGSGTTTTISGLAPGTYNFTVTDGITSCTSVPSADVVINNQPSSPSAPLVGTVTQPTCTLASGSVELSGLPASGTWTINPGGYSGSGTTTTLSGLAPGAYNFTVTEISSGCTSDPSATVVINPQPETPPTPVISQDGFVLNSDAPLGNQWYNQYGLILGATNQIYTVTSNGTYYDIVSLNGCSSAMSNVISVTNVGIGQLENNSVKVYPNPFRNELIIELPDKQEAMRFEILNSTGQLVCKGEVTEKSVVNTSAFTPGVYMIRLGNGKMLEYRKIVRNQE